uniref:Motilin/ghrelin-associated peptide domain-containing protein n=2 Tax=Bos TaxID=9903 RepID=A0ABI0P189_BOVIN
MSQLFTSDGQSIGVSASTSVLPGLLKVFSSTTVQKEKEKYNGPKKSLSVQQRSEEVGPVDPAEPWEEKQEVIKLTAPVEIGMRMNSRQLEKYQATLEGLLREVPLRGEGGQNLDTPTQRGPRNVHGSSTGFGRKTPSPK